VETGAICTAAPAKQSGARRSYAQQSKKCPPMAGFCELVARLRTPNLATSGSVADSLRRTFEKFPFFWETAAGANLAAKSKSVTGWLVCDALLVMAGYGRSFNLRWDTGLNPGADI
jgi:hypothetical protein